MITRTIDSYARQFLGLLVRMYKRILSPIIPPSCRFVPTCSDYALEALQRKSLPLALWLICRRVLRCNPFNRGGYDPVP